MGRRNEHSREQLRDMALEAADAIVAAQGPAGLTARKVAAAIGYTVGSLYMAFRNLDDLIVQLNARTLDELYTELQAAIATVPDPQQRVAALGRAYMNFACVHRNRWMLIFEHRLPVGDALPDWYLEKVNRFFRLVQTSLASLAPRRDPDELALAAQALWSGVHGVCILGLDDKLDVAGHRSLQEVADSLIQHYLAGFVSAPSNPSQIPP